MSPQFWQRKRELEVCGLCELANSGRSLKLTVDDEVYYVGLKDLENVLEKRKPNATVVRLVDAEPLDPDGSKGDPGSLLTSEIKQQVKHEAYLLNENKT